MKILIIHLGAFGDSLLFSPVLDQVAAHLRSTSIDLLCNSNSLAVFEHRSTIKTVISFPIQIHEKSWGWPRWRRKRALLKRLHQEKYDTVYDFTTSRFTASLVKSLNLSCSYGLDRKNRGNFYSKTAPTPKKTIHILKGLYQIVGEWGIRFSFQTPSWPKIPSAEKAVMHWWQNNPYDGIRLALHAGSNSAYKNWPVNRFRKLLQQLIKEYSLQIYLIGGLNEKKVNNELAKTLGTKVIDITPELKSFFHTAEFLRSMDLFLGCDSGPGHLAAAVGLPVVTIFSHYSSAYGRPLTDKGKVIEKDLPCRPCDNPRLCNNTHFMECLDHSVSTVHQELVAVIEHLDK